MSKLKQFTIECHRFANHIKNRSDLSEHLYDLYNVEDEEHVYIIKRHEEGKTPDFVFPDVYNRFSKMVQSEIPFITLRMEVQAVNVNHALKIFKERCENLQDYDFYISRYQGEQLLDQAFISNTNSDLSIEVINMTMH